VVSPFARLRRALMGGLYGECPLVCPASPGVDEWGAGHPPGALK